MLLTVLSCPGATQQELADRLDIHFQNLNNDLADLVVDGVLRRERVGRRTFYALTDGALERNPDLRLMAAALTETSTTK